MLCGFVGDALRSACLCETTFLALLQDECREFRDLFKKGKLSCTRENDPVRDSSGKQHSNKCIMCAEKLWVEKTTVSVTGAPWSNISSLSHPVSLSAKGRMSIKQLQPEEEMIRWDISIRSIDNSLGFSFKIKRQHYCTQLLCLYWFHLEIHFAFPACFLLMLLILWVNSFCSNVMVYLTDPQI